MTKKEREEREYDNLYKYNDMKAAKKAFSELLHTSLNAPAKKLPQRLDKDGNPTLESMIDTLARETVQERLKEQGLEREPKEAEVAMQSAVIRARFNDSTLNIILDRTAGKVKEEISVSSNPYEELSYEELELLVKHREEKAKKENG